MRKISKGLGFNILILSRDQNLSELYSNNYASKFMPESYTSKLAESEIVTINYLLPTVEQRICWPEHDSRTYASATTKTDCAESTAGTNRTRQ